MIALIPCRGGSKRISRKNIREFCGMPLLYWTIKQAHESGVFDKIYVSTDDDEIAFMAGACKWNKVRLLGQPMASDISSNVDVMKWVANDLEYPDSIMLLQCTSPLRTAEQIREAAGYMRTFETLVSVYTHFDGVYLQNGAIYGATTDFIKRTGRIYDDSSFLYLMREENSVDIDTETDWITAEALMKARL